MRDVQKTIDRIIEVSDTVGGIRRHCEAGDSKGYVYANIVAKLERAEALLDEVVEAMPPVPEE